MVPFVKSQLNWAPPTNRHENINRIDLKGCAVRNESLETRKNRVEGEMPLQQYPAQSPSRQKRSTLDMKHSRKFENILPIMNKLPCHQLPLPWPLSHLSDFLDFLDFLLRNKTERHISFLCLCQGAECQAHLIGRDIMRHQ